MRTASAGAVLAAAQRAQIVGDALGQHRHDAVGEIDRVAALQRLAVERRAGPHVVGDIGDGDGDDDARRDCRVGIRLGIDRVVVILGVGRIDGDERQRAPVLAAARRSAGCAASASASTSAGNTLRNAVGVDGDQADGALALERAEPLLARLPAARPIARGFFSRSADEIAVLGARAVAPARSRLRGPAASCRPARAGRRRRERAEDAEHRVSAPLEHLDDAAGIGRAVVARRVRSMRSSTRSPTPRCGPGCALRCANTDADFGRAPCSASSHSVGLGDQFAVAVAAGDARPPRRRASCPRSCSCSRRRLEPRLRRRVRASIALQLGRGRHSSRPNARAISRLPTLPPRWRG